MTCTIGYNLDSTLDTCCGVYEVGDFGRVDAEDNWCDYMPLEDLRVGGTGYFISTFVYGDRTQNAARSQLKKMHTLLYQSKPRTNEGTYAGRDKNGNKSKIILCVFLYGKQPKKG